MTLLADLLGRRWSRRTAPLAFVLGFLVFPSLADGYEASAAPRLAVVVVIDQLPRDYLDRFEALFGPGGFRRLLEEGADFCHCHCGYGLTFTSAGHAVMLSGSYPVHSGVVGNEWYERQRGAMVGCVEDRAWPVLTPSAELAENGIIGVSPLALRSATVGDTLRSATGARGKVVSVSLKDRSAVLMGGRRPNAAYWYDPRTCHFVTSSYYMAALPKWVDRFNTGEPCAAYVGKEWTKLRSDIDYALLADDDDVPYETDAYGLGRTFPHVIKELIASGVEADAREEGRYAAVAVSPFGNEVVSQFVRAAVVGEGLGRDGVVDLLAVSLSSNDYVGHLYGPQSQEVLDTVLRTDRLLAELMGFLDAQVGRGKWVLALTSDHGVAPIPEYLERIGLLAPRDDHYRFQTAAARQHVERQLARRLLGVDDPLEGFPGFFEAWDVRTAPFAYVDGRALEHLVGVPSFDDLLRIIAREIEQIDGVARVYRRSERELLSASRDQFDQGVYRAWHPANGGDLFVQLEPYWLETTFQSGTNHGSPYAYDTQVPMLLYGAGIRAGRYHRPVALVDLAPTLAHLLRISPPPRNEGRPMFEALR